MLQFSIRKLLLLTIYCAIGLSVSVNFGLEYFLWHNLLFLHVSAICVSAVAAVEYSGYRRPFFVGSLIVLSGFLIWMSIELYGVGEHNFFTIIAFLAAYYAGLISAATHRAINGDDRNVGPLLNATTIALTKILSRKTNNDG